MIFFIYYGAPLQPQFLNTCLSGQCFEDKLMVKYTFLIWLIIWEINVYQNKEETFLSWPIIWIHFPPPTISSTCQSTASIRDSTLEPASAVSESLVLYIECGIPWRSSSPNTPAEEKHRSTYSPHSTEYKIEPFIDMF